PAPRPPQRQLRSRRTGPPNLAPAGRGVDDDVVAVGALGGVKAAAAGDQSQRDAGNRTVDGVGREVGLRVSLDAVDDEPDLATIRTPDVDVVARRQIPQTEERGRAGPGVDVRGDDRGSGIARNRARREEPDVLEPG